MVYACHCTDCRRQSGSAYNLSMPSPREGFAVTAGEPAGFERTLPSGRKSTVRFCATCASRLFAESGAVVTLRPGTLDDTGWIRPAAQNFTRSALPGALIPDVPGFETQPADFAEIAALWRRQDLEFA